MNWLKTKRVKNPEYLRFVSTLPCLITGNTGEVQSHHCLLGGFRGMGMKNDDSLVLPLHFRLHHQLHMAGNERKYMEGWGLGNYVEIARELYRLYEKKDYTAMTNLIITREIHDL